MRPSSLTRRLLLCGLLRLLLQDLLLLGDLIEQRREGRDALGRIVADAIPLRLLGGLALGLEALLLDTLALGLGGGATALLLGALLLTALLCLEALGLGLLRGDAGLLGLGLLLGTLLRLYLGGMGVEDGLELLAHDRDIGVIERRGSRLDGKLEVAEVLEHLLAGNSVFLSEVVYARLCHVTYLPKLRRGLHLGPFGPR